MRRPITKSQRLSSITRVSYYQSLHFWAVKGFGVANIYKKPCCLNILLLHGRTATDSFSKNLLLLRFVAGNNWSGSHCHEWSGREKSDIAADITWYDYLLFFTLLIITVVYLFLTVGGDQRCLALDLEKPICWWLLIRNLKTFALHRKYIRLPVHLFETQTSITNYQLLLFSIILYTF